MDNYYHGLSAPERAEFEKSCRIIMKHKKARAIIEKQSLRAKMEACIDRWGCVINAKKYEYQELMRQLQG